MTPINTGHYALMKTTFEIPDALFKRARSAAAQQGIPLRELMSKTLAEKLAAGNGEEKPWLKLFGQLRSLRRETARISGIIQSELDEIDAEDRP